MENENSSGGRILNRREALAIFGAAGVSLLAACAPNIPAPAQPASTLPTAASVPTPIAVCTPGTKTGSDYFAVWQAAMADLDGFEATFVPRPTRELTLKTLIRALQQFGEGQFGFFLNGFGQTGFPYPTGDYPPLAAPTFLYTPEFVLETIANRISTDVGIIKQSIKERQANPPAPGQDLKYFDLMDYLAASALWPEKRSSGLPFSKEDTPTYPSSDFRVKTVLTYQLPDYDDATRVPIDIRIVPYAQVAFIGIPPDPLNNLKLLLSIPHEVGHFLHWYAYKDSSNLKITQYANIRERDYPYSTQPSDRSWSEEIFADIYGALIGGPLSVRRAMEIAGNKSDPEFTEFFSCDSHPTPILRPLVYLKAMLQFYGHTGFGMTGLKTEMESVVGELLATWKEILQTKGYDYEEASGKFLNYDPQTHATSDAPFMQTALTLMSPLYAPLDAKHKNVDNAIEIALNAIEGLLTELNVSPGFSFGWGWSERDAQVNLNWTSVKQLWIQNKDYINNLLGKAKLLRLEELDSLSPPSSNHQHIPRLWWDWATNGKGYLNTNTNGTFPPGALDEGNFSDMPPAAGSVNKWIRVFGSGGWSTEGPCNTKH